MVCPPHIKTENGKGTFDVFLPLLLSLFWEHAQCLAIVKHAINRVKVTVGNLDPRLVLVIAANIFTGKVDTMSNGLHSMGNIKK